MTKHQRQATLKGIKSILADIFRFQPTFAWHHGAVPMVRQNMLGGSAWHSKDAALVAKKTPERG